MTDSTLFPTYEDANAIHEACIARFGGLAGVRDQGLLESALAQPSSGYQGHEMYPTVESKAARFAFGIMRDHPFNDGNKRTATAVMAAFLRVNGRFFRPREDDLLATMMGLADGSIGFERLVEWVEGQCSPARSRI